MEKNCLLHPILSLQPEPSPVRPPFLCMVDLTLFLLSLLGLDLKQWLDSIPEPLRPLALERTRRALDAGWHWLRPRLQRAVVVCWGRSDRTSSACCGVPFRPVLSASRRKLHVE